MVDQDLVSYEIVDDNPLALEEIVKPKGIQLFSLKAILR
jgi:hypothetical protein